MIPEAEAFIRSYIAPVCRVLFDQDEIPVGLNRQDRIAVVQAAILTGFALNMRDSLRDLDVSLESINETLEESNRRLDSIAHNAGSS